MLSSPKPLIISSVFFLSLASNGSDQFDLHLFTPSIRLALSIACGVIPLEFASLITLIGAISSSARYDSRNSLASLICSLVSFFALFPAVLIFHQPLFIFR
jgi:hypothetical protein